MKLTVFLFFIVLTLVLFMYVYARYSRFDADIVKRRLDFEDKEANFRKRIEGLKRDTANKKARIADMQENIRGLRKLLRGEG